MVDKVAIKKSVKTSRELREQILALLDDGRYTHREIGDQLNCSYQLVAQTQARATRMEENQRLTLRDPATSERIEHALVRKLRPSINRLNAKGQSATDFKNICQGLGVLIDKARLFADKSTSNVQNRSLAVVVARRAKSEDPKSLKSAETGAA